MKPDDALPDRPFTPLPERRWRRPLRQMLWVAAALLLAAALATAVLLLRVWQDTSSALAVQSRVNGTPTRIVSGASTASCCRNPAQATPA